MRACVRACGRAWQYRVRTGMRIPLTNSHAVPSVGSSAVSEADGAELVWRSAMVLSCLRCSAFRWRACVREGSFFFDRRGLVPPSMVLLSAKRKQAHR